MFWCTSIGRHERWEQAGIIMEEMERKSKEKVLGHPTFSRHKQEFYQSAVNVLYMLFENK